MGFWDSPLGTVATLNPIGLAARTATDENFRANIPILGDITGAQSNEEKALLEKQKQLAEEAKQRRAQMQQARMNAMGQSILAFNPRNQMMAKMFGPEAAFTPQQFAQMGANPITAAGPPPGLENYQGTDPQMQAQVEEFLAQRKADQARQGQIRSQMSPVPAGPAPLQQRAPQAARRFG